MQYWSSVSFGLIVAMHVIQSQLKWVIVSLLLIVYTCYSAFCLFFLRQAIVMAVGASAQATVMLTELKTQGADLTIMREAMDASFSNYDYAATLGVLAPAGLYLLTIAYTVYRQIEIRRETLN
jgi:hypothetical protein